MQRTNELPLITAYFNTPVERVQMVQEGPDVDVVISLRETTEVTSRVIETPRGIVLWVDFPKSASFDRERDDPSRVEVDRPSVSRGVAPKRLGAPAAGPGEDMPPAPVQGD
jgi:hypothetical protein